MLSASSKLLTQPQPPITSPLTFLTLILYIEKIRYARKGFINVVIAVALLIFMIEIPRQIAKIYWAQDLSITPSQQAYYVFWCSLLVHSIMQVVCFAIHAPGYFNLLPSYQKYRINKTGKRPWELQDWPNRLRRTIQNLFINQFLIFPAIIYLSSRFGALRLRFHSFPSFFEVLFHIYLVYFVEDIFFYWTHRTFHAIPFLYKWHKVHHQNQVLYTPITQYFHPIDWVVGNLFPAMVGTMILGGRAHFCTFMFWQIFKTFISTEGHSGYEFPFSPGKIFFLIGGASYHDHHHQYNVGCFAGSIYIWDLAMGTNKHYMLQFIKEGEQQLNQSKKQ